MGPATAMLRRLERPRENNTQKPPASKEQLLGTDPFRYSALATRRSRCSTTTGRRDPRAKVSPGRAHSAAAAAVDHAAPCTVCCWRCGRPGKKYTNCAGVPRSILGDSVNATIHSTTWMYHHTCMVLRAAAAGFERSSHASVLVAATRAGSSEWRQDCCPIISILQVIIQVITRI